MSTPGPLKPFRLSTDPTGLRFLTAIARELIEHFEMSADSAVDKIDEFWSIFDGLYEDDIALHEFPEYWARQMYYGPETEWHLFDPVP